MNSEFEIATALARGKVLSGVNCTSPELERAMSHDNNTAELGSQSTRNLNAAHKWPVVVPRSHDLLVNKALGSSQDHSGSQKFPVLITLDEPCRLSLQ
jgi:hypothetical protein